MAKRTVFLYGSTLIKEGGTQVLTDAKAPRPTAFRGGKPLKVTTL